MIKSNLLLATSHGSLHIYTTPGYNDEEHLIFDNGERYFEIPNEEFQNGNKFRTRILVPEGTPRGILLTITGEFKFPKPKWVNDLKHFNECQDYPYKWATTNVSNYYWYSVDSHGIQQINNAVPHIKDHMSKTQDIIDAILG